MSLYTFGFYWTTVKKQPLSVSQSNSPPTLGYIQTTIYIVFTYLSQHVVPPQHRPQMEGLPALRAAVLSFLLFLVPASLNTDFAVIVSTRDGNWIFQQVQTY